jgi:hypothetical protein
VATDNWHGSNTSAVINISISNSVPLVALTNPVSGQWFFEGTNITLEAQASDVDGLISKVEFYADTNKLGELTNAPYTLVWSNVMLGNYALSAVATDNEGAGAASASVNINVISNQPPIITLLSPTNGQILFSPAQILVLADAHDSDGFIARVEFFEGANKLGEASNTPYQWIWSNAPAGISHVVAVASDNWRGSNSSQVALITITNLPPSVSIISPTNGQNFVSRTDIEIQVEATDADGRVQLVEIFANTNKLAVISETPYRIIWTNVVAGLYSLTSTATDNWGAQTASPTVNIVVSPQPPTVIISNPSVSGDSFVFSFVTQREWSYTVQCADSPDSAGGWVTTTNLAGDGTSVSITNTISASSKKFYRVIAQ